jgi:microcystin-dependent protein
MSYQVKFTETTNPAKPSLTVADQSLNSETSLVFPGKNYAGYAPVVAENFLHLLENFAKNTSPSNPVQGQLWYDNSPQVNLLKVFDGTSWTPAGTVKKAETAPSVISSIKGDLWVDTVNQQLYVYSGSNWLLIGPQFSAGLKTGPDIETLTDTSNIDHNVISMYSENSRIAIISKSAFTPKTAILGFSLINQGINLSTIDSVNSTTPNKFWGTAEKADALIVNGKAVEASNFLRKDEASTTNYPLNVRNNGGIGIGSDLSFSLSTDANSTIFYSKTSGNYIEFKLNNAGTTVTGIHIDANGYIGLGPNNTNPQEALDVSGNIITTGDLIVQGTTDADLLGRGSIATDGGLSVAKRSQFGGDVSINGGVHFSHLDVNGDPTAGTILQPSSDLATDLYDLGTSTRRFRNVYAQSFVGNFNGSFTGSLAGNISGSAAKLASPTVFKIRGDISTTTDVLFDGQTPQPGSPSGEQIFTTVVTADIISQKATTTDSFLDDTLLVYRNSTQSLKQVSKSTFISNIPIVPIAAIFPYAGGTLPAGYLFCDGSELRIGDYSDLFARIGYTYRTPSELIGKATFALPDLRGRFPLGRDNMDNTNTVPDRDDPTIQIPAGGGPANRVTDIVADTLGAGTGDPGDTTYREYITLETKNLPDHKHNLSTASSQYYASGLPGASSDPSADAGLGMPASSTGSGLRNSGAVIPQPSNTPVGQPFNAMNPYLTINYIIFTGVV